MKPITCAWRPHLRSGIEAMCGAPASHLVVMVELLVCSECANRLKKRAGSVFLFDPKYSMYLDRFNLEDREGLLYSKEEERC